MEDVATLDVIPATIKCMTIRYNSVFNVEAVVIFHYEVRLRPDPAALEIRTILTY